MEKIILVLALKGICWACLTSRDSVNPFCMDSIALVPVDLHIPEHSRIHTNLHYSNPRPFDQLYWWAYKRERVIVQSHAWFEQSERMIQRRKTASICNHQPEGFLEEGLPALAAPDVAQFPCGYRARFGP